MKQQIANLIAQSGAVSAGVGIHDLATGEDFLLCPDVSFHPASTFKLCVMMEVNHQAAQGRFGLDDSLLVKNEFCSIADGSPFHLFAEDDSETDLYAHVGKTLPVRDLVARMITRSSNLATNILIEKVTAERVTDFMQELGAHGLLVRRGPEDNRAYALGMNNSATARGLMQVLIRLAERRVVSAEASEEMIGLLLRQFYREGIPALLPEDVSIAHKTGWNDRLYHDAAIVFPPVRMPYVIVVLTAGLPEETEAPALVSQISRLAYDALTHQTDAPSK
jgi:beta-lactamase class A